MFKEHITKLKMQLNISIHESLEPYSFLIALQGPTVQGKVSLTCDAWQASNTDGYFVVTAHWIEELNSAKWELKSALIGFTCLTMHTTVNGFAKPYSKSLNELELGVR